MLGVDVQRGSEATGRKRGCVYESLKGGKGCGAKPPPAYNAAVVEQRVAAKATAKVAAKAMHNQRMKVEQVECEAKAADEAHKKAAAPSSGRLASSMQA